MYPNWDIYALIIYGFIPFNSYNNYHNRIMKIPYGSCVSWRIPPAQNGFIDKIFGYLQNLFTNCEETHCSIIMSEYPENDAYYEFEQSVTARINIYDGNPNSTVFDIKAGWLEKEIVLETMIKNIGQVYGFAQTLIFIVRWLLELVGIDGRRLWNPLGFLSICSEATYYYLADLAEIMQWSDLRDYLKEWNPNTFHSGDFREVLDWMVERNYAQKIKGE